MAVAEPVRTETAAFPYALLRGGYPYFATIGMRRATTYPMHVAGGEGARLYLLCPHHGAGCNIRRTKWDDEDLGTISSNGTDEGQLLWGVQMLRDGGENLYVSDEGTPRISSFHRDGNFLGSWGEHGSEPGKLNRPSGIAF